MSLPRTTHIFLELSPVHASGKRGLQLKVRRGGGVIVYPVKRPAPLGQLMCRSGRCQLLRHKLLRLRKDLYRHSVDGIQWHPKV